ncbi:MAG: DUF1990 domain-containing protein [Chloroflexota bacterium]|nr:DUF1990 domain-containing protein [Chloroflexota bacterium]
MRSDRALAALHGAALNFEPQPLEAYTPERGWHADAVSQQLPGESAGDPVPGGPWQIARRLIEDYRIADPAIVRAIWDPNSPLEGREMLLELRLYRIIRVRAGVRVTRVWDEERLVDGRSARVFGFEYSTLEGHVERGRMDYELCKWRDDGAVEFRLHAHSRAAEERAPWIRLGFRLFGRREQLRFYRRCCERIVTLTAQELGISGGSPAPAVVLREADAPETAELAERLLPRRTKRRA